jgi:hypothetical protein
LQPVNPAPIATVPVPTPVPIVVTATPLPNTLFIGGSGVIALAANDAVNVRALPSVASQIVGTINGGDGVRITNGPQTADGFIWWQIAVPGTNIAGWVIESLPDTGEVILVPGS